MPAKTRPPADTCPHCHSGEWYIAEHRLDCPYVVHHCTEIHVTSAKPSLPEPPAATAFAPPPPAPRMPEELSIVKPSH